MGTARRLRGLTFPAPQTGGDRIEPSARHLLGEFDAAGVFQREHHLHRGEGGEPVSNSSAILARFGPVTD
jgi:hypothetical protein